jgi:RNase adaptor protein for sRNA GlmZ degradation
MRTTLTLEPDVARQLRQQIAEKKLPLKRIVNDALRAGLSQTGKREKTARFTVEPHSFGFKPGIDRDKLGQLLDELEGDEFLRKYQR